MCVFPDCLSHLSCNWIDNSSSLFLLVHVFVRVSFSVRLSSDLSFSLNSRSFIRQELNGKQDEVITLSRFAAAEERSSSQREDTVGRSVDSHKGLGCSYSMLHHADNITTEDQTQRFNCCPIGLLNDY